MPLFCLWGGSVCLFCNSTTKANQFKSPMEMPCLRETVCILLTQEWLDLEHIFNVIKTSMIWRAPRCDLLELQWEMSSMKMIWCILIAPCFYTSWKSFTQAVQKKRKKKRKPNLIFPFSVWKIISAARDDFCDLLKAWKPSWNNNDYLRLQSSSFFAYPNPTPGSRNLISQIKHKDSEIQHNYESNASQSNASLWHDKSQYANTNYQNISVKLNFLDLQGD